MHGVRKLPPGAIDEARKLSEKKKLDAYMGLVEKYAGTRRAMHASDDVSTFAEAILALSGKLVEANPELYSCWNDRRRVLAATHALSTPEPPVPYATGGSAADEERSGEAAAALLEAARGELSLSLAALKRNIKSYWVWHHRKWVLSALPLPAADLAQLRAEELRQCEKLLAADARNFHCWGHRAWVRARMAGASGPEEEAAATLAKIQDNFSNYSAWHRRSLLGVRADGEGDGKFALSFDEERDLVEQAFFTEPEDQSAWFYHRWLMGTSFGTGETVQIAASSTVALRDASGAPGPTPRLCVALTHRVSVAGAQSALRTEPPVQGTWTPIAERRGLARVFVFTPLADDSAAAPEPPKLGAVADSDALAGPLGEPFEESSGPAATIPRDHLDLLRSLVPLAPAAHLPALALGWMMFAAGGDGAGDGEDDTLPRGVRWAREAAARDPARSGYYSDLESRLAFAAQVRDVATGRSPPSLALPAHVDMPASLLLTLTELKLADPRLRAVPRFVREMPALERLDLAATGIVLVARADLPPGCAVTAAPAGCELPE